MSTQINVIVDNGGLSEKARRQTQSNRWSKLESDNRQKVEAKGLQQRDANRLLSGIDANGRPLYGTPPAQPLRRDEPAATRRQDSEYFMLRPAAGPTNNQLSLEHKGLISYLNVSSGTPSYAPSGGPNGSSALVANNPPSGNYINLKGEFPFAGSSSRYKNGVKDFTLEFFFKFGTTYVFSQDEPDIAIRIGTIGYVDVFVSLQSRTKKARKVLDCTVRQNFGSLPEGVAGYNEDMALPGGLNLQAGAWQHFAVCKSANRIMAYLDGFEIGSTQVTWESIEFAPQGASNWADIYFGISSVLSIAGQPVYLHGLRFETKALYKGPFTPPPNL